VRAINILTINPKPGDEQDLVKIIEDATGYFPRETWDEIECVGELVLERDVKIAMNGVSCEALPFEKLVKRIGRTKTRRIGFASLFRINDESSSKVVAHGLGHSRGLHHHMEPIDFMYSGLLSAHSLQVEGFCEPCLQRLTEGQKGT
jgi:hypothetical protein